MDPLSYKSYETMDEKRLRQHLVALVQSSSIPVEHLPANLGLFLDSKALSRLLFMEHIYRLILDVPGVVVDLGTRWGQNAAIFSSLRGIFEPFNRHRRVIAFDTFTGFPEVSPEDGRSDLMGAGNLSTPEDYQQFLEGVLDINERLSPNAHIQKNFVVPGDCTYTFPQYLHEHPETIVALAYFDFDTFKPTKVVLEAMLPRLTRGSVLGFDELNDPDSPGETIALMDVLGLETIRLRRLPYVTRSSYFVVGD